MLPTNVEQALVAVLGRVEWTRVYVTSTLREYFRVLWSLFVRRTDGVRIRTQKNPLKIPNNVPNGVGTP